MSKLTSFYEDLIALCGIKIGDYGRLAYPTGEESFPLTFDDKPLVFPDKQYTNLTENRNQDVIMLHPLSESSLPTRGISEVQDLLRRCAIIRVNQIGRFLLNKAVEINRRASADSSYKLDHKLSQLFAKVDGVDEKFVKFWIKLDNKMNEDARFRLFNINLTQFGSIGNEKYDRIAVLSSPLYDQLVLGGDNNKVFDVTFTRKQDLATLKEIMLALFPLLAEGGYRSGSSSTVAPTFVAFCEMMIEVTNGFNDLLVKYKKEANGSEGMFTPKTNLLLDKDNLTSLRHALSIQDYNEGVHKDHEANLTESRTKTSQSRSRDKVDDDRREVRTNDVEPKEPVAVPAITPLNQPQLVPKALVESVNGQTRIYHQPPIDPIDAQRDRERAERDAERDSRATSGDPLSWLQGFDRSGRRDERDRDRYDDRRDRDRDNRRDRDDRRDRDYDDRRYSNRDRDERYGRDRDRDRDRYDDRYDRDDRRDRGRDRDYDDDRRLSASGDRPFWATLRA